MNEGELYLIKYTGLAGFLFRKEKFLLDRNFYLAKYLETKINKLSVRIKFEVFIKNKKVEVVSLHKCDVEIKPIQEILERMFE